MEELLEMLDPFKDIWDGHLGTAKITQHRIDLKLGARPSLQLPYRALTKQRELERAVIHKMLELGVIEPCI